MEACARFVKRRSQEQYYDGPWMDGPSTDIDMVANFVGNALGRWSSCLGRGTGHIRMGFFSCFVQRRSQGERHAGKHSDGTWSGSGQWGGDFRPEIGLRGMESFYAILVVSGWCLSILCLDSSLFAELMSRELGKACHH